MKLGTFRLQGNDDASALKLIICSNHRYTHSDHTTLLARGEENCVSCIRSTDSHIMIVVGLKWQKLAMVFEPSVTACSITHKLCGTNTWGGRGRGRGRFSQQGPVCPIIIQQPVVTSGHRRTVQHTRKHSLLTTEHKISCGSTSSLESGGRCANELHRVLWPLLIPLCFPSSPYTDLCPLCTKAIRPYNIL